MKASHLFTGLLISAFLFSASSVYAQDDSMAEAEKLWMEYMTPGEAHAQLAKYVGEWDTESKFWMQPGGEPVVSQGKTVYEMILGGRYLQSKHSSTAWGMEVEGLMIMGYDNATHEYTSIWIDNLGTGTAIAKGTYDPDEDAINWNGSMIDPISKSEVTFREVLRFQDDNHIVLEMYNGDEGNEYKSMEINFTR